MKSLSPSLTLKLELRGDRHYVLVGSSSIYMATNMFLCTL